MKGNTGGVFETYTHFRVRDLVRSEPRLEYIDLRVSRNPYHKQPKFNLVEGCEMTIYAYNLKGINMDNKVLEGALRIISSYQVDGIANFNQKDVECYCSKNTWHSYIKQLETLGLIEKLNENGYYPRYKVNEILPCPSYLIDPSLSIYNKAALLKLSTLANDYRSYANKTIYKELGSDSIRNNIKSIKDSTGKEWYEVLEESTNIVQTLDTTGLIDTDKGYKYAPRQLTTEEDIEEAALKRRQRYEERRTRNIQKENMAKTLLIQHKRMIKYRNKEMEFELTEDDIQDMLNTQDYKCYYTGLAFEDAEGKRPSIDRINSNKGYTKDNVVITLGVINLMKRDLELNEFIELCSQVANHFNNK